MSAKSHPKASDRFAAVLLAALIAGLSVVSADEKNPPASAGKKIPPQEKMRQVEPAAGGFCLVSYFDEGREKPLSGDPAHQMTYIGEVYYFSSAEAKKKFEAAPYKYLPQLGGMCVTALGGPYANRLPGNPRIFSIFEGRLYFYSSTRAKRTYEDKLEPLTQRAHRRFNVPAAGGHCPVSYRLEQKARKGTSVFRSVYRGYAYDMSSQDFQDAFDKGPANYVPAYHGFCPVSIADDVLWLGDPTVFSILNGKTYLLKDAKAKQKFDAETAAILKQADTKWLTLKGRRP